MEAIEFKQRLDQLVQDVLLAELTQETVDGFYERMIENFRDDPELTEYQFLQLEGNVKLILELRMEVLAA